MHESTYQSDFARRYVAQGRAEGLAEGLAEGVAHGRSMIIRLLTVRFGTTDSTLEGRIRHASVEELDAIAERLLSASTLQEALGLG
jgi:hypothetical protein